MQIGAKEYSGTFGVLEPGVYTAFVASAENKTSQAGNPTVVITWEDWGGAGQIRQNLNPEHPNPKAAEIGQRELGGIAYALGLPGVDTAFLRPLVGRRAEITVKRDSRSYEGKEQVRVAEWRPVRGAQQTAPQAAPAPYEPAAPQTFAPPVAPQAVAAPVPARASFAPPAPPAGTPPPPHAGNVADWGPPKAKW